jgi:NAD(P)-dependent dehydrogenase (short-subunit alcohol dehydrogenase family)
MSRVLITGCSTGIGRATAVELGRRRYEVIATARRLETIRDLDAAAKLPLDIDDDASVAAAVEAAGTVDVLVNNAAWGITGPIEKVPLQEIRALFETNVFGVLRMTQAVIPLFRERGGGTIVNVSSAAGRMVAPLDGAYSATKHAVEAITEALHYELGHFGIRVAMVEPGYVATAWSENERWRGIDAPPYDELYRQLSAGYEEGYANAASPEVVAKTIAEAIETDEPRLRWPVAAPHLEARLAWRAQHGDAAFKEAMWTVLGLDW